MQSCSLTIILLNSVWRSNEKPSPETFFNQSQSRRLFASYFSQFVGSGFRILVRGSVCCTSPLALTSQETLLLRLLLRPVDRVRCKKPQGIRTYTLKLNIDSQEKLYRDDDDGWSVASAEIMGG